MNKEILMVVDNVSNEKGVDKEIIFQALEAALASATRKRHGEGIDVRVAIDRKTGDYDRLRTLLPLDSIWVPHTLRARKRDQIRYRRSCPKSSQRSRRERLTPLSAPP